MRHETSHQRHAGRISLALAALAATATLSLLSACSSVMLEPGDHGQALRKALQAQRIAPDMAPVITPVIAPAMTPSSRAPPATPTAPAAVELKGGMDNYLQGRMPAASGGLTPSLGESLR